MKLNICRCLRCLLHSVPYQRVWVSFAALASVGLCSLKCEDFEWLGYSVSARRMSDGQTWIVAGSPTYRLCALYVSPYLLTRLLTYCLLPTCWLKSLKIHYKYIFKTSALHIAVGLINPHYGGYRFRALGIFASATLWCSYNFRLTTALTGRRFTRIKIGLTEKKLKVKKNRKNNTE